MGSNNELFNKMLARFEENLAKAFMVKLEQCINNEDWTSMDQLLNSLKGASSLVGAGRIHYACYYILNAYKKRGFEGILNYYPLLVEAVIEFQIHSKKLLAKYN